MKKKKKCGASNCFLTNKQLWYLVHRGKFNLHGGFDFTHFWYAEVNSGSRKDFLDFLKILSLRPVSAYLVGRFSDFLEGFFSVLKILVLPPVNPARRDPIWREKVDLNFYFHTSLWCLIRLIGLHKTFSSHHKEV